MKQEFEMDNESFVIKNYQTKPTFSSFLPGIAGKLGIPMWAFYVNRGQGIASFGVESKDNPLMEFYPANKSYENVEMKGFRTFIKIENSVYEPFREVKDHITSEMRISSEKLEIIEINTKLEIETRVLYFILPKDSFAGFIRKTSVKNLSDTKRKVKVLDGLPKIIPFGMEHGALKNVSQTITAWAKVYNLENNIPFYRLSASAEDEAQVDEINAGNFYISLNRKSGKMLKPIVDPQKVFDYDKSFNRPIGFIENESIDLENQLIENQFPCAMSQTEETLEKNESLNIDSIFGNVKDEKNLELIESKVMNHDFFDKKEKLTENIHKSYSDLSFTHSSDKRLNGYVQQNFLDNILRGGTPVEVGEKDPKIYHIFSRKHGDLERDYNEFSLEPKYFSQGNGNYRDVNQNRRSDIFFNPAVKRHNIKTFFDLVSLEGFNPLVINGQKFMLKDKNDLNVDDELLLQLISEPYSIGDLYLYLEEINQENLFNEIIDASQSIVESSFGEGYWVDHWTYNLDLIENYLRIYPDQLSDLFLTDEYRFYDSHVYVLPRENKYYLTDRGPRQYEALKHDHEKEESIKSDLFGTFKKLNNECIESNLVVKIVTLLVNKIASLDPSGIGIEMEANKPGWYDALNGLPGLFGSSFGETAEVYRWTKFIKDTVNALEFKEIEVIEEFNDFFIAIEKLLTQWTENNDHFSYWNNSSSVKEKYRKNIFGKLSGKIETIGKEELIEMLDLMLEKLNDGIKRAKNSQGLYTMFYSYEAIDYEKTGEVGENGLPLVKVNEFKQKPLSNFLEGQVKALKVIESSEDAKALHDSVQKSDLFDKKLGMYRVNGSLETESFEIGRAKAFSPGWLENGSIWLHMEYKYLLELLKNGLYETFIECFNSAGICYQPPSRYKRSIFENSSFILSSLNSDEKNHGRGYIARLSGATAEFIDMWTYLNFGAKPFKVRGDELVFEPEPIISGELFTKEKYTVDIHLDEVNHEEFILPQNTYSVRFLGKTMVIYHNPKMKSTFGEDKVAISSYRLTYYDGSEVTVNEKELRGKEALDLRSGLIKKMDIVLD